MAAAPAGRYAYAIPSLSQSVPDLPPLGNLDVNRAIVANAPVDAANLRNAKHVAENLKTTQLSCLNPGITEAMIESAELRMRAIEGAHVSAKYAPDLAAGIAEILQRLQNIDAELANLKIDVKISNAIGSNQRIIARNAHNQPLYEPLQKTTPGSGYVLLNTISNCTNRQGLNNPDMPAAVGSTPDNFRTDTMGCTMKEIHEMVIFYNDSFGIVAGDDLAARHLKFSRFLSHY